MHLLLVTLLGCLPKLDVVDPVDTGTVVDQTDTQEDTDPPTGSDGDSTAPTDDTAVDTAVDTDPPDTDPPDTAPPDTGPVSDADGDGYDSDEDCDDDNPDAYPGADEYCDGTDTDCDDRVDEGQALDASEWYFDGDEDGYGVDGVTTSACDQPDGFAQYAGDCDDTDAAYNPGADESCTDPNDYNCDGSVGYEDGDGDGFAACEECDDSDAAINPDADEVCDDADNDCDGDIDGGALGAPEWYLDSDEDGYGDALFSTLDCEQPDGYEASDDDCDDSDAAINPGADEICDDVDNNCDSIVDDDAVDRTTWYEDNDGDGWGSSPSILSCEMPDDTVTITGDCDDTPLTGADINPDADEICDGVDNNCDEVIDDDAIDQSTWYADSDEDGYGDAAETIVACDAPGGYTDDDSDCDDDEAALNQDDADGDGYSTCDEDCDDSPDSGGDANPGATEVCDGLDNDCDGDADSGAVDVETWYGDADEDGWASESDVTEACDQPEGYMAVPASAVYDCDDSDGAIHPEADEVCDEEDNDCDSDVDEDAIDAVVYYIDADGDGWGTDDYSLESCDPLKGLADQLGDCDDTDGAVNPDAVEVCDDGIDNDCDAVGCSPEGTVTAADSDVIYYGDEADDHAGQDVAIAGDVDGDGSLDLLIAAKHEDTDSTDKTGAAFLVFGPIEAGTMELNEANTAMFKGADTDDKLQVVAGAGDVDADGFADVLIGGGDVDYSGVSNRGAAYLFSGQDLALGQYATTDAVARLFGTTSNDKAGTGLAGGDVNNDESSDLLIGTPKRDDSSTDMGAVYIIRGPVTGLIGLDTDYDDILTTEDGEDEAGDSVASADVDGDGVADILVGAPGYDESGNDHGAIYVALGPVSSDLYLEDDADAIIIGPTNNDFVGEAAAAVGDTDGDGYAELLIGAPQYDDTNDQGAAWLYTYADGTVLLSSADATIIGDYNDTNLGVSVSIPGDVDGDGKDDLLIGAKGSDDTADKAGSAYLFYGPVSGSYSGADADLSWRGDARDDELGTSVTGGDLDGDGFADIVVGAPKSDDYGEKSGAVYVLFGNVF